MQLIADELARFSPELAARERWLVLNKKDLLTEEELAHRRTLVVNTLHWEGEVFAVSALTGEGINALIQALMARLAQLGQRYVPTPERALVEEEAWDPLQ